jgi:hypothetical protein
MIPRGHAAGVMGIRQSGEPRESVASGKGVCGGFAFARPRRSSEAVLSSFRHGRASLRSLLAHMPFPETAFRTFRGHGLPSCLHGGPKPTPRPGEGGSPARRRASPPRRSKPLSPPPHVTADNESASSRPHRHVTRSVRRRKDVQDRRWAEGGDDLWVKRAVGSGMIGFFRWRRPRVLGGVAVVTTPTATTPDVATLTAAAPTVTVPTVAAPAVATPTVAVLAMATPTDVILGLDPRICRPSPNR